MSNDECLAILIRWWHAELPFCEDDFITEDEIESAFVGEMFNQMRAYGFAPEKGFPNV